MISIDPVATCVAALVGADRPAARLAARHEGSYYLVFQRFPRPVGVISPSSDQSSGGMQAIQQRRRSGVFADSACGHREANGPPFGIRHGVALRVQPVLRWSAETAALVVGASFRPQA